MQVVDDGRRAALGAGKQTRLLARLLLDAGEVESRDRLIDALWGASPPASAANALQVQIHGLRKLLGQERITTEGPGYRLRVEPGELDAERFERLVALGRDELAAGDADAAATTLRAALALWRGQAFEDVVYEEFAQAEIARLEELRLVALEERIEADLVLAHHDTLAPELEALAAANPTRERLRAQLMLALYRGGRQADALAVFRRTRRALREELGLEPSPELRQLHQAVLRQDPSLRVEPPGVRARRHLPAPRAPLVGRLRELEEVGSLLRAGVRLVTLTGAGGIGKTRLALQIAHDLADAFDDGVFFVDLSALREPELVPSALADALGVEEHPGEALLETLCARLRDQRLLVLVDNFEVVDHAAPLLGSLLEAADRLSLLVTSRAPLRLTGEHEYRVAPLPLSAAVRLFAERARAVAPRFRRPSEEAEEVSELCRRVDCLPLAIELAAARTRDYSPAELLSLFPGSLELASDGPRDVAGRHRALRATIDWSYELLTPGEQVLLAGLAVFAGGCTAASAASVCGAARGTLASLVSKSLLYERLGSDGEPRYAMLETVRAYALDRLADTGEEDALRRRHAEHQAARAEAAEHERATDSGQRAWQGLEDEQDNFRAALDWSSDRGDVELELRLAAALAYFWLVRGQLSEGRGRLEAVLQRADGAPPELLARTLFGAGRFANSLGDDERMRDLMEESLAVYRSIGDQMGMARALDGLGIAVNNLGDTSRGVALNQESAALYRALGDDRGLAITLNNLGLFLLALGQHEEAAVQFEEALTGLEALGLSDRVSVVLGNLGLAALLGDRPEDALDLFRRGIALANELDYTETVIYDLEGIAATLWAMAAADEATVLLGAAEAAGEAAGVVLEPLERRIHDETVEGLKEALGDAFATSHAAGRLLTRAEAVALALGRTPLHPEAADLPIT